MTYPPSNTPAPDLGPDPELPEAGGRTAPWEIERPATRVPLPTSRPKAGPYSYSYTPPPEPKGIAGWWRRLKTGNAAPRPERYTLGEATRLTAGYWANPVNWAYAAALLVIIIGFIWQAQIYWIAVIDDAYITFRHSEMLARGFGLRYNPGGQRVEGYTNFLWMVTLAGFIRVGWDAMFCAKIMGMVCAILTIIVSFCFSRDLRRRNDPINLLPPIFLAFNAHFAHWALMGLETLGAVFLVFYAFHRFHKEMRDQRAWLISPIIATLAAMTRVDSLYYLSPLGLYGLALVLQGKLPLRRMLVWGLIAGSTFGFYFWSKILYFEDPAPNTYYAKQRYVTDVTRPRGRAHVFEYYCDQNPFDPEPANPAKDPRNPTLLPTDQTSANYLFWLARGGKSHSLWWINWWAASLLILLAFPTLRTWLLILAPPVLNLYFVYHVDGDWMPAFRFLQIAAPFLAVGGAAAIGRVQDVSQMLPAYLRLPARVPVVAFMLVALVGLSLEQLNTGWVSVWFKEPTGDARRAGWHGLNAWWTKPPTVAKPRGVQEGGGEESTVARIRRTYDSALKATRKSYAGGFSPPLEYVSNWMLLHTVDRGSIVMSDIGQPMWYCAHLDLYDYDGLTDKYFAHAPSVRGKLPSYEEVLAQTLKERNIAPPSAVGKVALEVRLILASLGLIEPKQDPYLNAVSEARRKDFVAQGQRNVAYIYEQIKPEYLLFFYTPTKDNPSAKVWTYPEEAGLLFNDPRMDQNYTFMDGSIYKTGTVTNNFFRRKDVPTEIPDATLARRFRRVLRMNPRFHLVYAFVYRESLKLKDKAEAASVRDLILKQLDYISEDGQVISELTSLANQAGDIEMSLHLDEKMAPEALLDPGLWRQRAEAAWNRGQRENGVKFLEKAVELSAPGDNFHLYHMTYYYYESKRIDDAIANARRATQRVPRDARAWMDLAGYSMRASGEQGLTPAKKLAYKRAALEGFEGMMTVQGSNAPPDTVPRIKELKAQIEEMEKGAANPAAPEKPAESTAPTTATLMSAPSPVAADQMTTPAK